MGTRNSIYKARTGMTWTSPCFRYKTVESKEEEKERLDAWEKFLEGEDEEKKPSNDKKPEPVDEKKLEPEPMET